MAEDQSFRELLGFVDAALAPDAEISAAEVQGRLGDAMPDFLNLLQQKVIGLCGCASRPVFTYGTSFQLSCYSNTRQHTRKCLIASEW